MTTAADDKNDIRELLAEYCFELDGRRFAKMAALFLPDGTWDTAFGKGTGRDGIEALMRKLLPEFGTAPRAIHFTTNIVITLDGDRAHAVSNWLVTKNSETGPYVDCGGSYTDDLVRQDGRWWFVTRKIDRFIAKGLSN